MRALDVLIRLNKARRRRRLDAAHKLDVELEQLDLAGGYGYRRSNSMDCGASVPSSVTKRGPQRNPNWRAALDKLNAMRGRVR